MKVLFVTNAYPSVQKPWEGAAVQVQRNGLEHLGIVVDVLYLPRTEKGQKIYITALYKIWKLFKRGKFDILHIQFGGVQALLGVLAAGKRCVITFHGTDLHGGNPLRFKEKITNRIGTLCSKIAASFCGARIVVSKNLLPLLGKYAKWTEVIPTGIDYEKFYPIDVVQARKKINLKLNMKYVIFCDNNNDAIKRRDVAEHALMLLKESIQDAKLLLLNQVPFEKVPLYLNSSNVLLVTSDKEGSPNIVKEALACNIPIVSVNVGDVSELISGIENCFIVRRDVFEIAKTLHTVIMKGMRTNGRGKRRSIINNSEVCEKLIKTYESILSIH